MWVGPLVHDAIQMCDWNNYQMRERNTQDKCAAHIKSYERYAQLKLTSWGNILGIGNLCRQFSEMKTG